MLARPGHEQNILTAYVGIDLLEDPYIDLDDGKSTRSNTLDLGRLIHSLVKKAGVKGSGQALQEKLEAEMRKLWPGPEPGQFGNASPYLLYVTESRGEPLWCRRVVIPPPASLVAKVRHFGGVYQPLHLRRVDNRDCVVAGRKRRASVLTVNRQCFLAWVDEHCSGELKLISTVPVLSLTHSMEVCEEIASSENVDRVNASKIDLVFWAHRFAEQGKSVPQIAGELQCSEKTVGNYLALQSLVGDGLVELQHERLALDVAFRLAKEAPERQQKVLDDTELLTPRKRRSAILEALDGAKKAAPPREVRRTNLWMETLAKRDDRDSMVAAAVLRFQKGDVKALDDYPSLQAVFELQAGDTP